MQYSELDQFLLRCFRCDPETGRIYRTPEHSRYGDYTEPLAWTHRKGYLWVCLGFKGRRMIFAEHRLGWFLHHGYWPQHTIDHRNGDKTDNRLENLRDVSNQHNRQNTRKAYRSNKSGLLGVCQTASGRWEAAVKLDGKKHYAGLYDTPQEAHAAYIELKRKLHPGCTI